MDSFEFATVRLSKKFKQREVRVKQTIERRSRFVGVEEAHPEPRSVLPGFTALDLTICGLPKTRWLQLQLNQAGCGQDGEINTDCTARWYALWMESMIQDEFGLADEIND